MNIEEWSNIFSIFESIAVALSIIFIGYELRQKNKINQASSNHSIVELSMPFKMMLVQDKEISELWNKTGAAYENLSNVDKSRYINIVIMWLVFHENIYYQYKQGMIDKKVYKTWEGDLLSFIKYKNISKYWGSIRTYYHPDFSVHLEKLIEKISEKNNEL